MTSPVCVWPTSSSFFARPKSVIFGMREEGREREGEAPAEPEAPPKAPGESFSEALPARQEPRPPALR